MPHFSPPANDNLSRAFKNEVPSTYRGTDNYLDIVTWNLRWFNDRGAEGKKRTKRIVEVMTELNADIFVLEEIKEGSLAAVVDGLTRSGAGNYETAYGLTGGDQRVAMLYDLDWVRAKDTIGELFKKGEHKADGKDAFPRLPLHAYFGCLSRVSDPFEFQLVGLHLKSQVGGGGSQRKKAAEVLAKWMSHDAPAMDADVILLGDWNAVPGAAEWEAFHELERKGKAAFARVNDDDEYSHLMYKNRQSVGSRLDLGAVTVAAEKQTAAPPSPVTWKSLQKVLESNASAGTVKKMIAWIKENVTDHLPVVTRFYIREKADA